MDVFEHEGEKGSTRRDYSPSCPRAAADTEMTLKVEKSCGECGRCHSAD